MSDHISEGSTWAPHRALSIAGPAGLAAKRCNGTLRFAASSDYDPMLLVICDDCSEEFGVPRAMGDADYLGRRLFTGSGLSETLALIELAERDEQARARSYIGRWLSGHEAKPPLLWGPTGTGKTLLLHRLGRRLCFEKERRVRYFKVNEWVRIRRSQQIVGGGGEDVFRAALECDVLIFDDFGAERKTDWTESELQDVIYARHDAEKPIIGATNLPLEDWVDHFGDRAASRLMGACEPIHVGGIDMRLV